MTDFPPGSELDELSRSLDRLRDAVLRKTDGLDSDQLARRLPPSDLTLGGLLNHLALGEESWFRERFTGLPPAEPWAGVDWEADPDWEFRTAVELSPEALRRRYADACERSRAVVREVADPERRSARLRSGRPFTLRWVLLHMIEETARHAGHADLLREAVDGSAGG